ncbi:AAA family ATPase [uncultured Dysosmobacter sp.]|uniref:AAA family ATPase n=1 Tax=uncultured Dysosmobacter sp. TaxID=2591384 RepID=UPI00261A1603|nr:DnaB-like helicase C-terminal domain-containing protein [uncultured Dysosmobacter sp.]
MRTLFDASPWLTYFPDKLDTSRALWFVRDVLDVSAVQENAVCLATGADFSDFVDCLPFFTAFPAVFLALADPEMCGTVAEALGEYAPGVAVLTPGKGAFRDHETVREVLAAGGQKALDHLMIGAIERPAHGLLDLASVEREDLSCMPSVLSGIPELDRAIGGFYGGELSIWTGKRGGGKSTLLGQLLLEAVNQGQRVCAYSGELAAWRFKQWVMLQAAGPEHVTAAQDRFSGKMFYTVSPLIQKQIDEWWRGRFFLYDNRISSASDENSLLTIFEYAVRRYGCSVFLVDNLMTTRFSASRDSDFYRAQSNFTGRLVEVAKKHEVHIHLVAHPRKGDNSRMLDADDVGGSGDVTNRADNVFSVKRLEDGEAETRGFQTVLRVLKNRSFGETISIGLNYDIPSRRFYKAGTGVPNKHYGWEFTEQQTLTELPAGTATPFDGEGA